MKGFLSDAGAEFLKKVLQEHAHPDGGLNIVLTLVISTKAGWKYYRPGQVQRTHEPVKLMREVAYEVLTGRNYWVDPKLPVEKLFECNTFEEMWKKAEELTNGYIKR